MVYIVGIAVDGYSEVNNIKPIVLVKRSGKVSELEQEISGLCILFSRLHIFRKIYDYINVPESR